MGDANLILNALQADIQALFTDPPAEYTVPIATDQILNYMTAPSPEVAISPNHIIMHVGDIGPGEAVAAGRFTAVPIRINLISYYNDDTSKLAAEHWINDAAELLIAWLETAVTTDYRIVNSNPAQRDRMPFFYGQARTAIIQIITEVI